MLEKANKPFVFGNGSSIRNSVLMAPMTTWAGTDDGQLTATELSYYRDRAKDVGMVITATSHVSENGRGLVGQFYCGNDSCTPQLSELAGAIHSGGAKAVLQIFHAGRSTSTELSDDIVSASAIEENFAYFTRPRAIEEHEIETLIEQFVQATKRAIKAGFDGVELHGANGYLLQQFLSPATNQRQDKWGGSLENRVRLPLAIVDAVIKAVKEEKRPDFIIGYRLTPEEVPEMNPGLTLDDGCYFASKLSEKSLSYLHVSLQDYDQLSRRDESNTTPVVSLMKQAINGRLPLIGVGNVKSGKDIDKAIELGCDLVAVGRALVTEPRWLDLVRNGKAVRTTISEFQWLERNIPEIMLKNIKINFPQTMASAD